MDTNASDRRDLGWEALDNIGRSTVLSWYDLETMKAALVMNQYQAIPCDAQYRRFIVTLDRILDGLGITMDHIDRALKETEEEEIPF